MAIKVSRSASPSALRLEEILTPSPGRNYRSIGRQIGTMTLQHLAYPAQLKAAVSSQAGLQSPREIPEKVWRSGPTHGMDHPWQYRNKAQPGADQRHPETQVSSRQEQPPTSARENSIFKIRPSTAILRREISCATGYSAYGEESRKGQISPLSSSSAVTIAAKSC